MIGLTPKQRDVLNFVKMYLGREGVPPTLNEIAAHFRFTCVTAFGHLRALEKKGRIRRVRGKVRALEVIEQDEHRPRSSIPVYGYVAQGKPLESAADYEELELRAVVPPDKDLFVLRLRGEALAEAGLRDGDYLVLERRARPENGAIALVLANGSQAVLGRLYREGESRLRIEPLDAPQPPIRAGRALVQGVLSAVVRRF